MSQKKQIFKLSNLKKLLTEENSCISLVPTTRLLALPPFFLNDLKSGILYMLSSMLKKYDRSLGGIVIGYQNIKVLMDENTGIIPIGTSETEVNVSVEFYIFQPKIGSYLEGIINKKSNTHIGCLVHHYFNATILKADNIDYEDWICKDFSVDDKIIFKVIDLDFTSLLPYIEGIVDDENLLDKNKSNLYKNNGTYNLVINNVNKSCHNVESLFKEYSKKQLTSNEEPEDLFKNKEGSNKSEEDSPLEESKIKNVEQYDSVTSFQRKKRKKSKGKKKLLMSTDYSKSEKEKSSDDKETTPETVTFKTSENHSDEKMKTKENFSEGGSDIQEDSVTVENYSKEENSNELDFGVLDNSVQLKHQNLNNFVKLYKRKKEKMKKKDGIQKPVHFNQTIQGLSSQEVEDNILYSTLLDQTQMKKMKISFCSPIPQSTPLAEKKDIESSTQDLTSVQIKNQEEADKKDKKKQKKQKKKEEKEKLTFLASKKIKTSDMSSFRKEVTKGESNDDKDKYDMQIITEKLYRQQLQRVKEALNMSDKDSCVEEKKGKSKFKKREKELLDIGKNEKAQINGIGVEKESEACSLLDKLYQQELQRVKEELNKADRGSSIESKNTKLNMNKSEISKGKVDDFSLDKQNIKGQINGAYQEEKKSVQDMVDELLKQEMNRVKENLRSSDTASVNEKKEIRIVINKQETSKEGTHDSLFEKLLEEAKNAIDLGRSEQSSVLLRGESEKKKNKKDSDFSDFSISSSKKKNLKKKKNIEMCLQTPGKYRNGSMYDMPATPKRVNPDKSLFSDSERSLASPSKRVKETNGIETELGKSLVQNLLHEFSNNERKRPKSESDKETLKILKKQEKKKIKSEQKSQSSGRKEESLYEKLLREAKNLIDTKGKSLNKKKKKKLS